ncbi:hypothetical protein NB689_001372 [Xanthomonas sacchari]|nr:hypothetical protein [Xanthomonas sacchari]
MFDDPVVLDIAQRELAPHARLFVNTMTNDIASGKPMRLSAHFTDQRALRDPAAVWGGLRKHGVSMIQTDEPLALQRYLHGTDTPR